jgi:hypothetical protein
MAIFLIKEVSLNQALFEEKVNRHKKEKASLILVLNQGMQRGRGELSHPRRFSRLSRKRRRRFGRKSLPPRRKSP